ncbi:MAG TPA: hypothetical protein VJJ52_01400 [Candidatus Nanoarchaeia archaeon]|nr:hypothetical protein [Candidatus Nanoarchaeia archaeon]
MNILEINLNNLGFANFKKIIDLIIPKKERRQSNIIIGYIRIYTHLNNALNLMNQYNYKRAIEHLKLTKNIIKQLRFDEERPYLARIKKILDSIIGKSKSISIKMLKDESSDPLHIKTSMLLAQNICILRILKTNKY